MDLVVFTEAKTTQIQHVNKKSSDELLRKFADPDVNESKSTKRRRKSATNSRENVVVDIESNNNTIGFVEKKRLLLVPASKRRSLFLRQFASGKSHLRNKSLVRTIGKVISNPRNKHHFVNFFSFFGSLKQFFFLYSAHLCSDMA